MSAVLTCVTSEEIRDRIDAIAKRDGLTRSVVIKQILEMAVEARFNIRPTPMPKFGIVTPNNE